jgi:2-keto-4-pentenoate hydratase/2-oxohepta-3-ene-1,7-dioic acid hydratase in catechol pathway
MRIVRYDYAGQVGVGTVRGPELVPCAESLDEIIAGTGPTPVAAAIPLEDVKLLAPVAESSRGMFCFGINYVDHQIESAKHFSAEVPKNPIIFFKTPSALADPHGELELDPLVSTEFDWEVELGVVIGKAGRNIAPDDVAQYIFGYTVVNDVTARDLQKQFSQWHIGKNIDRATPVGPWIVTADEIAYPPNLEVTMRVDGVEKQRAATADMIFDLTEQICTLSRYLELLPGDIIATGTPSGVGFTRTPPEFLTPGSVAEAEISSIGMLVNVVSERVGPLDPALT